MDIFRLQSLLKTRIYYNNLTGAKTVIKEKAVVLDTSSNKAIAEKVRAHFLVLDDRDIVGLHISHRRN